LEDIRHYIMRDLYLIRKSVVVCITVLVTSVYSTSRYSIISDVEIPSIPETEFYKNHTG